MSNLPVAVVHFNRGSVSSFNADQGFESGDFRRQFRRVGGIDHGADVFVGARSFLGDSTL